MAAFNSTTPTPEHGAVSHENIPSVPSREYMVIQKGETESFVPFEILDAILDMSSQSPAGYRSEVLSLAKTMSLVDRGMLHAARSRLHANLVLGGPFSSAWIHPVSALAPSLAKLQGLRTAPFFYLLGAHLACLTINIRPANLDYALPGVVNLPEDERFREEYATTVGYLLDHCRALRTVIFETAFFENPDYSGSTIASTKLVDSNTALLAISGIWETISRKRGERLVKLHLGGLETLHDYYSVLVRLRQTLEPDFVYLKFHMEQCALLEGDWPFSTNPSQLSVDRIDLSFRSFAKETTAVKLCSLFKADQVVVAILRTGCAEQSALLTSLMGGCGTLYLDHLGYGRPLPSGTSPRPPSLDQWRSMSSGVTVLKMGRLDYSIMTALLDNLPDTVIEVELYELSDKPLAYLHKWLSKIISGARTCGLRTLHIPANAWNATAEARGLQLWSGSSNYGALFRGVMEGRRAYRRNGAGEWDVLCEQAGISVKPCSFYESFG